MSILLNRDTTTTRTTSWSEDFLARWSETRQPAASTSLLSCDSTTPRTTSWNKNFLARWSETLQPAASTSLLSCDSTNPRTTSWNKDFLARWSETRQPLASTSLLRRTVTIFLIDMQEAGNFQGLSRQQQGMHEAWSQAPLAL
jgi:hypothetical protein